MILDTKANFGESARRRQGRALSASFLAVLVAGSLSLPILPVGADPIPASRSVQSRLQGQVRFNKISTPEVGVQLLEKIFSKVMNLPQLAMATPPSVQQMAAPTSNEQRERDQLMIRPKSDKPKPSYVSQTPSLRVLPPTNMGKYIHQPGESQRGVYGDEGASSSFLAGAPAGGSAGYAGNKNFAEKQQGYYQNFQEPNIENWKGSQLAKAKESKETTGVRDWDGASADSFDSVRQYALGSQVEEESAPSSNTRGRRGQDLGASVGKLANLMSNVNRKMEEAQQLADAQSAPAPASPRAAMTASHSTRREKAAFASAPRQVQILDERPVVRDFRQAAEVPAQLKLPAGPGAKDKMPSNAIAVESLKIEDAKKAAGNYGAPVSGRLLSRLDNNSPYSSGRANQASQQLSQLMRSGKRELIALLPPTVATGIPLVTLGTSQRDALSAMQRMGQIKEQRVGQWTVITCKKDSPNGPTSLQLYFRHGLLDAMRIFDPSLIAPDFGVAPGDSLEKMKGKFGEPAFMLEEPSMLESQNYIYPISQVGFQLARRNPDADPQVVSVLIFSVK